MESKGMYDVGQILSNPPPQGNASSTLQRLLTAACTSAAPFFDSAWLVRPRFLDVMCINDPLRERN